MHVLGVRPARGDQTTTGEPTASGAWPFLEWTIDGLPLRDLHEFDPAGTTMLQPGAAHEQLRTENLRRLRGEHLPLPVFEPRYHRTRLDQILHLRGTPHAPSGTAFEDGRVGLVYCPCEDLDCGVLTARVEVTATTVAWREIGWQVTYEPFAPEAGEDAPGARDLVFDRRRCEELIDALLVADWSEGLPRV